MPTITVISPFYYPDVNGISNVVQLNVKALLDLGYKVNVVSKVGSIPMFSENVYTFNCYGNGTLFNKVRGIDKAKMMFCVFNLSKESELIILHGWHSWSTNLVLDISETLSCKLVLYSHGTSFRLHKRSLRSYVRIINYLPEIIKFNSRIRKIAALISITNDYTHYRCHDLRNLGSKEIYLLPNPIKDRIYKNTDPLYFEDSYKVFFSKNQKVALCISNFEVIKNQLYLLHLVKKYLFKLILVGSEESAYLNILKKFVHENNIQDFVKFKINISEIETSWLLENCHFFLFASTNDFCPLVLIESAKNGLPFISLKTADIKLKGGLFANNYSTFEYFTSLFLDFHSDVLHKIGKEGIHYYESNHSFESYKKKLNNIINQIHS